MRKLVFNAEGPPWGNIVGIKFVKFGQAVEAGHRSNELGLETSPSFERCPAQPLNRVQSFVFVNSTHFLTTL